MPLPNSTVISSYESMIAGIQKNCANATFILRGQTYTASEAIALVQTLLDAAMKERTAKGDWQYAMAAAAAVEAASGAEAKELRQLLAVSFSNMHNALADFGMVPKKVRAPLSTDARLAATAKLQATRKARGTTSKKQKLQIFGNVTGVTIAPVTTPASSGAPGAGTKPA